MYLLAADRANNRVADIYSAFHPAVLRSLNRIATAVDQSTTDLAVCGSSAEDPAFALFLMGIGIRKLSVSPHRIRTLHELVSRITIKKAESFARTLLGSSTIAETKALARDMRSILANGT